MKKIFIGSLILLFMVIFAGCSKKEESNSIKNLSLDCQDVCANASSVCSTFMPNDFCLQACEFWDDEQKKQFGQAKNCQELVGIEKDEVDLQEEVANGNDRAESGDCESACSNYALKCLSADGDQSAFNQKFFSCIQDCTNWSVAKAECFINALDCSYMEKSCDL